MSDQKLGKYILHDELGRGGYGTVYRATDSVLEVQRAVKVLHPALVADPSFIERFRREAKFAARMKHPNIVPVYDLGEAEGRFFLAMEYMPGGSLRDVLTKEGSLSWERTLEITRQIAEALDHIHKQDLIHRDVKPGNILFDDKGNAYLTDLGFAKALSGAGSASLSITGGMIGTPAYMAPEIWMGEDASPQSDVYSLACVFVEMLTGESLFGGKGDSPSPLVMKRHFDPLVLPTFSSYDIPNNTNLVLEKALVRDPNNRIKSGGEFVNSLVIVVQSPQPSDRDDHPEGETIIEHSHRYQNLPSELSKPITFRPSPEKTAKINTSILKRWQLWVGMGGLVILLLCVLLVIINSILKTNTDEMAINLASSTFTDIPITSTVLPAASMTAVPTKTIIPSETITPSPTSTPKTLVFSSRLFSPPNEQEYFIAEIITPFENEYNITINFQVNDDQTMLDNADVQQSSNHVSTDVVVVHNSRMSEWIEAGWVEDLSGVVDEWNDRNFSSAFSEYTNVGVRQYFLPASADVYLLLANNKALPYLPSEVDLDAITWEEYAAWAVAIANGEGYGKVCITGIPAKSWIYMFGATGLSYGAGFPDINSAGAMEAWKIWETIGKYDGFVSNIQNIDSCVDPMMREESWLTVTHHSRVGQVYIYDESNFTIAPAPIGTKGSGTLAGVSGYAITKGSANYDSAIKFLEYLTRPDIQVKIAKGIGGFIPPVQEATHNLGDEAIDQILEKGIMTLNRAVVSGVPAGDYQDWGAVKQCFDEIFDDTLFIGAEITQDRLDQGQSCVDSLLK
ncbi:MAG: extracellular solute-binding protein [Anaerolineales bacterium]|nr:extracellular solute-binding protein [Chloroflexota bacterium]MBL6981742.1 extracellular solute-binding protein [Anaerolineales bacterium]